MVKRIIYGAKSQLSHLNFQISFFTFKMQIIIVPITLDFLPVILYPANLSIKSACRTKIFSDFSDLKNIFLLKEYVFFGLFRLLPPPPGRRSGHTALALSSRLLLSQRRCRLPPVTIMISYRDLISHDEMFSDIYKMSGRSRMGCVWRWRGRWSVGQRVTSMTRSLVEMPPMKAPRAKVSKAQ